MRSQGWFLLLAGFFLSACRFSPGQSFELAVTQVEVTATAHAAAVPLPVGEELSALLSDLLLTPDDLPIESRYYLANPGDSRPFHNTDVVSAWGGMPGWDYLQATGRVDGYYADYLRGSEITSAPEEFFCNVTLFATPEGAQLSISDYNLVAIASPDDSRWSLVESPELELGDMHLVLTSRVQQEGDEDRVRYRIEFSSRNYVGVVVGSGPEDQVSQEFMEEAARALLAKIESAP